MTSSALISDNEDIQYGLRKGDLLYILEDDREKDGTFTAFLCGKKVSLKYENFKELPKWLPTRSIKITDKLSEIRKSSDQALSELEEKNLNKQREHETNLLQIKEEIILSKNNASRSNLYSSSSLSNLQDVSGSSNSNGNSNSNSNNTSPRTPRRSSLLMNSVKRSRSTSEDAEKNILSKPSKSLSLSCEKLGIYGTGSQDSLVIPRNKNLSNPSQGTTKRRSLTQFVLDRPAVMTSFLTKKTGDNTFFIALTKRSQLASDDYIERRKSAMPNVENNDITMTSPPSVRDRSSTLNSRGSNASDISSPEEIKKSISNTDVQKVMGRNVRRAPSGKRKLRAPPVVKPFSPAGSPKCAPPPTAPRKQKKDANDTTPTSAISNTITASTTTSSTTTGNTITTAISSAFPTDTCSSTNNQAEPK